MSNKTIIVKKVKKGGHGGHHGGSWKVAYADFVTAMMAFFLLLWLITMSSPEKRARISAYFKHFSLFTQGGTSFIGKTSSIFDEVGPTEQKVFIESQGEGIENVRKLENILKQKVSAKISNAEEQLMVQIDGDGIKIQVIDKKGRDIFEKGSDKLTPRAKEILKVISNNIRELPQTFSIEGHTDSTPLGKGNFTNWELSTARAAAARRELEANGISSSKIERISGFADRKPLIKERPDDPRNRRITIVINPLKPIEKKKPVEIVKKDRIPGKSVDNLTLKTFEEILSVTKEKLKQKKSQKKEGNASSETTKWGHVIKKEDWSPVIKEEKFQDAGTAKEKNQTNDAIEGYLYK